MKIFKTYEEYQDFCYREQCEAWNEAENYCDIIKDKSRQTPYIIYGEDISGM